LVPRVTRRIYCPKCGWQKPIGVRGVDNCPECGESLVVTLPSNTDDDDKMYG
jgi:predicted RNA-binding Zn-ribbon protein involved in translation (DUF1610 family)